MEWSKSTMIYETWMILNTNTVHLLAHRTRGYLATQTIRMEERKEQCIILWGLCGWILKVPEMSKMKENRKMAMGWKSNHLPTLREKKLRENRFMKKWNRHSRKINKSISRTKHLQIFNTNCKVRWCKQSILHRCQSSKKFQAKEKKKKQYLRTSGSQIMLRQKQKMNSR